MNAAIYVRISADREGRELGVQRQEEDCRKLATELGLTVVEVFSDNDISASTRSRKPRPAYARMLAEVDAGRIGTVLAYSTSRLTRRPLEFEGIISRADAGRLRIATVVAGEVDLTTSDGQTMARVLAAFDAREAKAISERSKRERQQRREQGRWHGGFRPFGFEPNGVTPRAGEQDLIKSGAAAVLAGRTVAGIARDWSAVMPPPAWRPPLVVKWRGSTVRDILTNPRVAGMLPGGTKARDWSPIVDEETWRGVVAVLSNPGRKTGRGDIRLLTGIAHCGVPGCGGTLNAGQTKAGTHTYRCLVGRHLDRAARPVDDYVRDVWIGFVAANRVPIGKAAGPSTGDLAGRAAGIRARLAELEASLSDAEGMAAAMIARSVPKLEAELLGVEADMAEAAGTSALAGLPADEDGLRAVWMAADTEKRRSLILAAPLRITVLPPGRGVHSFDPDTAPIERV